jgi:hypothetical protein
MSSSSSIALLSSLRQLEEQHAQANEQLVDLSAKYSSLQHEHACLTESHGALQLDHQAMTQSNMLLRADLERVRVELSASIRNAQQARQSSLEGFRQLVSLEREACELRESEAATRAKFEALTHEVQGLRQSRGAALGLQDVHHSPSPAFKQPTSTAVFNARGEAAENGASALTRPIAGTAVRRPRSASAEGEVDADSGPAESPPGVQTPASKRLFNRRKGADGGKPEALWEVESVHMQAADAGREVAPMLTKLRATPVTRDKRRAKYLLGKSTATLKPGLV